MMVKISFLCELNSILFLFVFPGKMIQFLKQISHKSGQEATLLLIKLIILINTSLFINFHFRVRLLNMKSLDII